MVADIIGVPISGEDNTWLLMPVDAPIPRENHTWLLMFTCVPISGEDFSWSLSHQSTSVFSFSSALHHTFKKAVVKRGDNITL